MRVNTGQLPRAILAIILASITAAPILAGLVPGAAAADTPPQPDASRDSTRTIPIDLPGASDRGHTAIAFSAASLVIGHRCGDSTLVMCRGLNGAVVWKTSHPYAFGSLEIDRTGRTVLVNMGCGIETLAQAIVHDGSTTFEHCNGGRLWLSPYGRFVYRDRDQYGKGKAVLSVEGEEFPIVDGPNEHLKFVAFVDSTHAVATMFRTDPADPWTERPGQLVLMRLPADVVWTTEIPVGEYRIYEPRQSSAVMRSGYVVIGDNRLAATRPVYCHRSDTGGLLWKHGFEHTQAVAIVDQKTVAVLGVHEIWLVGAADGEPVERRELWPNRRRAVLNAHWVTAAGDAVAFSLRVLDKNIRSPHHGGPVNLDTVIIIRRTPEGDIVLKEVPDARAIASADGHGFIACRQENGVVSMEPITWR